MNSAVTSRHPVLHQCQETQHSKDEAECKTRRIRSDKLRPFGKGVAYPGLDLRHCDAVVPLPEGHYRYRQVLEHSLDDSGVDGGCEGAVLATGVERRVEDHRLAVGGRGRRVGIIRCGEIPAQCVAQRCSNAQTINLAVGGEAVCVP